MISLNLSDKTLEELRKKPQPNPNEGSELCINIIKLAIMRTLIYCLDKGIHTLDEKQQNYKHHKTEQNIPHS